MFGSRTTVKKVRNSLTWFSQEADGFRCLGGLGYAATRAKPLLGRFLSPSLVALYRDDECSNSWYIGCIQ